jgi:hypothetical protein
MVMQFLIRDANCPRCLKPVYIASIEPHPTRTDIAHHNYECIDCGPVFTGTLSLLAADGPLNYRPTGQSGSDSTTA